MKRHKIKTDVISEDLAQMCIWNARRSWRSSHAFYLKKDVFMKLEKLSNQKKFIYPLTWGFSDFFIIPKDKIQNVCHFFGIFSSAGIFTEIAIPTTLCLNFKEVITIHGLGLNYIFPLAPWAREKFLKKYNCDFNKLCNSFPEDCVLIHPIKLSQWKVGNKKKGKEMKEVKLSIVIPVYKTAAYLPKCLDSVLNQTLEEWEAICIDDGSPDDSGKILDEYAIKDERIRVIHKENGGVNTAYNRGLAEAQGEYIVFLDSDDWVDPNMYEIYYRKAKETNADIVTAEGFILENMGKTQFIRKIRPENTDRLITSLEEIPEFISHHIIHWNSMFKRSMLRQNNVDFPEGKPDFTFGDATFIWKAWGSAQSLFVVKGAYYHYARYSDAGMHFPIYFGTIMFNNHRDAHQKLSVNSNMTQEKWYLISRQLFNDYVWLGNTSNIKDRLKVLSEAQRLFKQSLENHHVRKSDFSKDEWECYLMIANFPNFNREE